MFLLPAFVWFFRKRMKFAVRLLGLLLALVFANGTLENVGFNPVLLRIINEGLVVILFALSIGRSTRMRHLVLPGAMWLGGFVFISLISGIANDLSLIQVVLYLRDFTPVVMLFYAVANLNLDARESQLLYKLMSYLFLSQIGAVIWKLFVFQDVIEPYIGTMAVLGGSLTLIFSLVAISILLGRYLSIKRPSDILFVVVFIAFSVFGGKRATIFLVPFMFITMFLINAAKFEGLRIGGVRRLFIFAFLSVVLMYLAVRLMPSLNPEREVWGSFDLEFAMGYSSDYVTFGAGGEREVGRAEAPAYLLRQFWNESGLVFLVGEGAGHLVKSSYNSEMVEFGSFVELSKSKYGVGYGARTPMLQHFLQTGILGVLSFFFLLRSIHMFTLRRIRRHWPFNNRKMNYLSAAGMSVTFVIDYCGYSVTTLQLTAVGVVFAVFYGLCSNHNFSEQS